MAVGVELSVRLCDVLPALQTLERSYLLRVNGVVVERPQHMLMRVSVGIHKQVRGAAWAAGRALAVARASETQLVAEVRAPTACQS